RNQNRRSKQMEIEIQRITLKGCSDRRPSPALRSRNVLRYRQNYSLCEKRSRPNASMTLAKTVRRRKRKIVRHTSKRLATQSKVSRTLSSEHGSIASPGIRWQAHDDK